MQASTCAMVLAQRLLSGSGDHHLLTSAKSHLENAIAHSEQYRKLRDSVYWQSASAHLKRRTREKLNYLAFHGYTELLTAIQRINEYAEAKTVEDAAPPQEWGEIILNLRCAFEWIEKEHGREVKSLQLTLF